MQPTSALHHHAESSLLSLPQVGSSGRTSHDSFKDAQKYLFTHTKKLQLNGIDQYTGGGKHDTFDILFEPIGAFTREPLQLVALDMAYASDRPWRAINAEPIGSSINCYKTNLEMHCGQTLQVAIKFGEGYDERDDLVKEAYMYNKELLDVQGEIVPEYIGIFHKATPRPNKTLPRLQSCLVLTYVGEALPCRMSHLPPKKRYECLSSL